MQTFFVFHGVCLLWVLFRSPTISIAYDYFSRLLLPPYTSASVPPILIGWLVAFTLTQHAIGQTLKNRAFTQLSLKIQGLLALAAIYLILAYASAKVNFIYFTF